MSNQTNDEKPATNSVDVIEQKEESKDFDGKLALYMTMHEKLLEPEGFENMADFDADIEQDDELYEQFFKAVQAMEKFHDIVDARIKERGGCVTQSRISDITET